MHVPLHNDVEVLLVVQVLDDGDELLQQLAAELLEDEDAAGA